MNEPVFVAYHENDADGKDFREKILSLMQMHEQRYQVRPTLCKIQRKLANEMGHKEYLASDLLLETIDITVTYSGNAKFVYLAHPPRPYEYEHGFAAVKLVPELNTICDFLTERVRAYYNNPGMLKNTGQWIQKGKGKKLVRGKDLTPQQRAVQDYGGSWVIEDEREVYYWQEVRLGFFMTDKTFRRL